MCYTKLQEKVDSMLTFQTGGLCVRENGYVVFSAAVWRVFDIHHLNYIIVV